MGGDDGYRAMPDESGGVCAEKAAMPEACSPSRTHYNESGAGKLIQVVSHAPYRVVCEQVGMDLYAVDVFGLSVGSEVLGKLMPDTLIHFHVHYGREPPLISDTGIRPVIDMDDVKGRLVRLCYGEGIAVCFSGGLGKVCQVQDGLHNEANLHKSPS